MLNEERHEYLQINNKIKLLKCFYFVDYRPINPIKIITFLIILKPQLVHFISLGRDKDKLLIINLNRIKFVEFFF